MQLTKSEVLARLEDGNFDALIGQFESDWLECKGQPYNLSREDQKLELAKDISSLANANGGLLLIGFSTSRTEAHSDDCVDAVRPFPNDLFDKKRYTQVISHWLFPQLDNLRISIFPVKADPERSIAAIDVPRAIGADKPVLVTKTILDSSHKVVEILFGYCTRRQANVDHHDVERIQNLLRDGERLDAEIRDGFQSLHAAIEDLRTTKAVSVEIASEDVRGRILDSLSAVGLQNKPAFVLASTPCKSLNLRSIFESKESNLVKFIDRPPEIRFTGFDLDAGGNSRIVEGRLRRSLTRDYKLIEVHRDGVVIYVSTGGQDGLCWGRPKRQTTAYLINQIVLIENVYLFTLMLEHTYSGHLDPGETIRLEIQLLRMAINDQPCRLEPGPVDSYTSYMAERSASAESKVLTCEVKFKQVSPERVAILLLSELYAWFGFEEDRIPYSKQSEEGRIVDVDALIQFG